jgi:hypothetical protein
MKYFAFIVIYIFGSLSLANDSDLANYEAEHQRSLITKDVKGFCEENVIRGVGAIDFGWDNSEILKFLENRTLLNKVFAGSGGGGWMETLIPTVEGTRDVLRNSITHHGQDSEEYVEQVLSRPSDLNDEERNRIQNHYDEVEKRPFELDSELTLGDKEAIGLCSSLTLTSVVSCSKGLQRLRTLTAVRGSIMLPLLYKRVLLNPDYREGLRIGALKVLNRISVEGEVQSNFFDDLKDAYIKAGSSPKQAEDRAWDVIGLVSTAGPNLDSRLDDLGVADVPLRSALNALAAGPQVLDARGSPNGHLYSYPRNAPTSCNQGKPYHFWMSAYLARFLSQELDDTEGAAAAVYLAEEGYQMFAKTGNRDPIRAFAVSSLDPANNLIRMDLAYSALGSRFGATSVRAAFTGVMSYDTVLRASVSNSKVGPGLPREEVERRLFSNSLVDKLMSYLKWKEIFAADQVYNSARNQIK